VNDQLTLRLLGSVTSPYVRRVRIVAAELGRKVEFVDVFQPEGLAELRATTPIWKVPVARFGDEVVFDSHAIVARLRREAGDHDAALFQPFDASETSENNLVLAVDGALDALINAFYLRREGVDASTPYLVKQHDRARSCLEWLSTRLADRHVRDVGDARLDWIEVTLATALAWMRFRDAYPVSDHPELVAILDRLEARESFVATRPG
jgi:glutathione S-transferase